MFYTLLIWDYIFFFLRALKYMPLPGTSDLFYF